MHQYAHVGAGLPVLLQTNPGACIAGKPVPQLHTSPWPMHQYAHVGAGLPVLLQTNPGACIAGKPAPTTAHKPCANAPICPCGSRLAGDASDKPGRLHRWQASSHKCTQALGQCTNMPMWEPACRRCFRHTAAPASLASQLPQLHTSHGPMHQYAHVAAGLPAMLQTYRGDCIAGKPAPTSAHKPWANTPRGSRLAGDGCPGCMLSLPASAQRGVYVHQ